MTGVLWERLKQFSYRLTQSHKRNRVSRYGLAIILVLLVLLFKLFLKQLIPDQTSYHLLTLIVIITAWYGGMGPGFLAVVLAATLDTTILSSPRTNYSLSYMVLSIAIFAIGGIVISLISEAKGQADKQKDDFIGFASHELKNPHATIQGYAQLLQSSASKLTPQRVRTIGITIEEQTKRATGLINELLDLTKIESGKLSVYEEEFSIFDLVRSIVENQNIIVNSHEIILEGKSSKKVFADKIRIGQVIINLISNAIQYSPNARKVIVSVVNGKHEVVISVKDFGKGIAENNRERVFEAYFRENASKEKTQGLGLGLYISAEIIERHNGRIWVESTVGKGSTFYIAIPTTK